MSKWNFVAMGQVGLTGWTREVAKPVARAIGRMPSSRPGAPALSQPVTLRPPAPRTATSCISAP